MNKVIECLYGMSNGNADRMRILQDAWARLEPFADPARLRDILRQFGGGAVDEAGCREAEAALARPTAVAHQAMVLCACLALAHMHRNSQAGLSAADAVLVASDPGPTFSRIPTGRLGEAVNYLALVGGQEPEEEDEGDWKSDLLLKISSMTAIVQRIPGTLERLQAGIREALGMPTEDGKGQEGVLPAKGPAAEDIAREVAKEVAKAVAPLGKPDLEPVMESLAGLKDSVERLANQAAKPCYLPMTATDTAMLATAMVAAAALACGATGGNFYGLAVPLIPLALLGYLWAAKRWRR